MASLTVRRTKRDYVTALDLAVRFLVCRPDSRNVATNDLARCRSLLKILREPRETPMGLEYRGLLADVLERHIKEEEAREEADEIERVMRQDAKPAGNDA